jgi:hypothetical protein
MDQVPLLRSLPYYHSDHFVWITGSGKATMSKAFWTIAGDLSNAKVIRKSQQEIYNNFFDKFTHADWRVDILQEPNPVAVEVRILEDKSGVMFKDAEYERQPTTLGLDALTRYRSKASSNDSEQAARSKTSRNKSLDGDDSDGHISKKLKTAPETKQVILKDLACAIDESCKFGPFTRNGLTAHYRSHHKEEYEALQASGEMRTSSNVPSSLEATHYCRFDENCKYGPFTNNKACLSHYRSHHKEEYEALQASGEMPISSGIPTTLEKTHYCKLDENCKFGPFTQNGLTAHYRSHHKEEYEALQASGEMPTKGIRTTREKTHYCTFDENCKNGPFTTTEARLRHYRNHHKEEYEALQASGVMPRRTWGSKKEDT